MALGNKRRLLKSLLPEHVAPPTHRGARWTDHDAETAQPLTPLEGGTQASDSPPLRCTPILL